jgi:hypothetical protein
MIRSFEFHVFIVLYASDIYAGSAMMFLCAKVTHRHLQRDVSIAMDYGLDGQNSTPSRGRIFSTPQCPDRPTQPPLQWIPWVRAAGA